MLISPAYAQVSLDALDQSAEPGILVSMAPLALIFLVFYFFVIRPQKKRFDQHRAMISDLSRGDDVITGGGIVGKIKSTQDDTVTVEIAKGVEVTVKKATLMDKVEDENNAH